MINENQVKDVLQKILTEEVSKVSRQDFSKVQFKIDELENSLVRLKKFYQSNKKVQRKILKNKSDCKIIVIIR